MGGLGLKGDLKMKANILLEDLKEHEEILNKVAERFNFSFKININSKKTANLILYKKSKNVTSFEILTIEVKSKLQFIIRKNNEIIVANLYYNFLLIFMYNYLYYENIQFIYQFNGRKI